MAVDASCVTKIWGHWSPLPIWRKQNWHVDGRASFVISVQEGIRSVNKAIRHAWLMISLCCYLNLSKSETSPPHEPFLPTGTGPPFVREVVESSKCCRQDIGNLSPVATKERGRGTCVDCRKYGTPVCIEHFRVFCHNC